MVNQPQPNLFSKPSETPFTFDPNRSAGPAPLPPLGDRPANHPAANHPAANHPEHNPGNSTDAPYSRSVSDPATETGSLSGPLPASAPPTAPAGPLHLPSSLRAEAEMVIPLGNDEYLPALSRWTSLGGLMLLAAVAGGIGLAAVTPSPVVVRSPAIVRPEGEIKVVQATAEGKIQSVSVEEGQDIQAGDVIAVLDDSRLQTRQRQLENAIQQNQSQIQQLQLQIGNLETQMLAEQNLTERSLAAAQAEQRRLERERSDRQAIAQKEVEEAEALASAAQAEAEAFLSAAEAGVMPRIQAENKYQEYLAAKARLERAQTGLNPDRASIDQAQENIAQVQARGDSTLAGLQRQRAALAQQQTEIRQRIAQDQQELDQLMTESEDRTIRAHTDGNLLQLNLRNAGQVVRPGDVVAQIFPAEAELTIKAQVAPQDIGKVEVGQAVNMRVSAYSYADYGTLNGRVVAIASDTTAAQSTGTPTSTEAAPPAAFEITIEPDQHFLMRGDRQYNIAPGMEIQADIVAREETVLTLILRKARLLSGI